MVPKIYRDLSALVMFIFPLFLADLEKKYKNESEFDKE